MGKKRLLIFTGSLLGACLLVSVAGLAATYFLGPARQTGPTVFIKAPHQGEGMSANETTLVQALARDPSGIVRVELWVDGELVALNESNLPQGSNPFPFVVGWQPAMPGQHTLMVRAYNKALRSGQAAVVVETLDLPRFPPEPTYEVKSGDTLETIAAQYDASAEELRGYNPDLKEPLEAGDTILIPPPSPEEEDPPRPEEPSPETPPEESSPELEGPEEPSPLLQWMPRVHLVTTPKPSVSLEIEGVYLEVDKEYNGLYCYVSLAGAAMERVPGEGYLESLGERRWGIETEMGGVNKHTVTLPEGQESLSVNMNCIGYNESEEGGVIYDLGTLTASHPEEEWDGRLLERTATGMHGSFQVGYRIRRAGIEGGEEPLLHLPLPTNLNTGARWDWTGYWNGLFFEYPSLLMQPDVESDIRFNVYRDDNLLYGNVVPLFASGTADPEYNQWFVPLWQSDFFPTCPNTYEFYMTAYVDDPALGHIETGHSNSVFTEADPVPCYRSKVVKVAFEYLRTGCLDVDDYIFPRINPTSCPGYHDPNTLFGYPYGDVWVNGEDAVGIWGELHSQQTYEVDHGPVRGAPKELVLAPLDDLTVEMALWDPDVWSGADRFCPGEYTIGHWELDQVAKSPPEERKRTYEPEFKNSNGNCWLKFTVEVLSEF